MQTICVLGRRLAHHLPILYAYLPIIAYLYRLETQKNKYRKASWYNVAYRIDETAAHPQPAFRMSLLSASDVSRLANTKQLGVSYSLKQYSIMAPCRPVITNSLSDGWTLFCRMSDKWLLCTNQSTFIDKIQQSLGSFALWQQTPKHILNVSQFGFGQKYCKPASKMSHAATSNTFNIIARILWPILK